MIIHTSLWGNFIWGKGLWDSEMTLILNFNSLTTGIINFLASNSSTIDEGLVNSLSSIDLFPPDKSALTSDKFPAISVDLKSCEEEPGDFTYGRKNIKCTWEIGCHVQSIESHSIVVTEMKSLVQNVANTLRTDVGLSTTFNQTDILGIEFDATIVEDGVYQRSAILNFETLNFIQ